MTDTRAWVPELALEQLTVRRALQAKEDNFLLSTDIIREAIPLVTMSMVHLAIHSPTESVRHNAAKYIMDRALGKVEDQINPDSKPAWEAIYESVLVEAEDAKEA